MTPRPRKKGNAGLPINLYKSKVNGVVYFSYKHPQTKKLHGMGKDKTKAIEAAKQLNSMLMTEADLVSKVIGHETLGEHIKWFEKEIVAKKKYAAKTLEVFKTKLKQMREHLGEGTPVDAISVNDISEAMSNLTARSAQQFRQVAIDVFRAAVGRGLIETNPAEIALKPIAEDKKRQRMSMEQFKAAHEAAPLWLQNAMDLALISLQRRSDIVNMRFDRIADGSIEMVQQKTQKYDTGYLRIAIGERLEQVISRCRDNIASPYLVHRDPERRIRREGMHWTQIKPEYVTRQFKAISDELKEFKAIPEDERPTFHEIRALGIKLYRDKGIDPQQLAGHASENQTNNYDSDHDQIRWVEVETL